MKSGSLKFDTQKMCFRGIVGTGGLGSGRFFMLNGDHTLGREESRSGHFLDKKDYCKQHIILHYVKVLMGEDFTVIPVGKLGDDEAGKTLYNEMAETGFVMDMVETMQGMPTLYSFCFSYPDGTGGNLTTDNSACSYVDAFYINNAYNEIRKLGNKGIVLAVPEVPVSARKQLLETGKKNGLFCTASFTTGEIEQALHDGIIKNIDLIALNIDEASAVAGNQYSEKDSGLVVRFAIDKLREYNADILVSVTEGKSGSWCWDSSNLNFFPAIMVDPVNTAGAGDAFLSGLLCGISSGLHMFESQQLATLIAGMSVTSHDTINKNINKASLFDFYNKSDHTFSENVIKLLENN